MAIATRVPRFNSAVRVGRICEICCGLDYRIVYYTHAAEFQAGRVRWQFPSRYPDSTRPGGCSRLPLMKYIKLYTGYARNREAESGRRYASA